MSWIDDYHVSFIALEQELEKVREQRDVLRRQVSGLQEIIVEYKDECIRLQKKIDSLQHQSDHHKKWCDNYISEIEYLKSRLEKADSSG